MKKLDLMYKYQVKNDIYEWPLTFLATANLHGVIYHMDISENLSQMHKCEPRSSNFTKQKYSLHCTVKHDVGESGEGKYTYLYNLSDDKKHSFACTFSGFYDLIILMLLSNMNPTCCKSIFSHI